MKQAILLGLICYSFYLENGPYLPKTQHLLQRITYLSSYVGTSNRTGNSFVSTASKLATQSFYNLDNNSHQNLSITQFANYKKTIKIVLLGG
jgi:hypothetical protein